MCCIISRLIYRTAPPRGAQDQEALRVNYIGRQTRLHYHSPMLPRPSESGEDGADRRPGMIPHEHAHADADQRARWPPRSRPAPARNVVHTMKRFRFWKQNAGPHRQGREGTHRQGRAGPGRLKESTRCVGQTKTKHIRYSTVQCIQAPTSAVSTGPADGALCCVCFRVTTSIHCKQQYSVLFPPAATDSGGGGVSYLRRTDRRDGRPLPLPARSAVIAVHARR